MSTVYPGVAASGDISTVVSITIPADGDPDNAATFDAGMQRLADYAEALRRRGGAFLSWSWAGAQAGTFGASNTIVTLAPTSTVNVINVGTDVTASSAPNKLTATLSGTYRVWLARFLTNGNANVVSVAFQKNGSTAVIPAQDLGPMPVSGGAFSYATFETYITLLGTDFMQVGIYGTSGQAYSVTGPTQFFGMQRV